MITKPGAMKACPQFQKIAAIALFLVACFGSHAALALTCTTNNVKGNWNSPATWSGCGGGVPGAADNVVIANFNRTYAVTANAAAASLTFTGGAENTTLTINNGVLLTINGNTVVNGPTSNSRTKLIDVAANGRFTINGNLTLTGGGAINRSAELRIGSNAGSNVAVTGDVNVNNTTALVIFSGAGTMNIGGNFANGGTFTRGTGTVVYNGAINQNIGNYTYNNTTINKAGGTANLSGAATTVAGLLTLTQGNIVTGADTLNTTLGCATSVARTSGHVVGNLRKSIPAGASSCTFQIGNSANYTPVVTTFVTGTQAGTLDGAAFTPDHTSLGTSGLNTELSVNRYWRLTRISGLILPAAGFSAMFNFAAGDVDAGADTAAFEVERYVAPDWFPHTAGTRTATSTQATGITDFGDFAVGERRPGYTANLGRFNAFETDTPAGALRGNIKTKIAGAAQGADIIHLNSARTALQAMTGSAAQLTVRVELLNASDNSGPLDANNCRSTWTVIQTLAPNPVFLNNTSRMTVTFNEPNVWRDVRVRVNSPATGTATQIGCSTDRFAIRPSGLVSVNATDGTWASDGIARALDNTGPSGGYVHKAGQPFTLRATAQNAAGVTTGNYNGSPTVKMLACTLPTPACANGTLTPGVWSAASGTVTSSSASYSEVGSFNLTLEDQTFAAVDSADSTLVERAIPQAAPVAVGRFVPDHFDLATASTPQFKTFNDATCATRSFTYIGQPFGYLTLPQATITAKNAAGVTTTNYAGALWKLVSAGATQTYSAATGTLDTGLVGTPVVTASGAGVGSLTANAADVVAFTRTTPIAPFMAAISLSMSIVDSAENTVAGNGLINTASPALFSSMAFDSGNEIRFGQLVLTNAHGAELLDLPVQIEARFWNGSGFTRNAADACTQLAANQVTLSGWRRDLNACETSVTLSGRFIAGRGKLKLSKPGAGNTGSVDLKLNLTAIASGSTCIGGVPTAAAGASKTWLQGRWTGVGYDQNPAARASFGLYRGGKSLIYLREMY